MRDHSGHKLVKLKFSRVFEKLRQKKKRRKIRKRKISQIYLQNLSKFFSKIRGTLPRPDLPNLLLVSSRSVTWQHISRHGYLYIQGNIIAHSIDIFPNEPNNQYFCPFSDLKSSFLWYFWLKYSLSHRFIYLK